MFIHFIALFTILSASTFAAITSPEKDTLLDAVSESLFLKARLEKARAEEKKEKIAYENRKKLFEKQATTEMDLRTALWHWNKAEIIVEYLSHTLRNKELEVKTHALESPSPQELEEIYKEKRQKRLAAARSELKRAYLDQDYYRFSHAINTKLLEKGAVSKEEFNQTRVLYEGTFSEIEEIKKTVLEMQKNCR